MPKLSEPARESLQLAIFIAVTILLGNIAVKILGEHMRFIFWGILLFILVIRLFYFFIGMRRLKKNFPGYEQKTQEYILKNVDENTQWELLYKTGVDSSELKITDEGETFIFSKAFIAKNKHNFWICLIGSLFFLIMTYFAWLQSSSTKIVFFLLPIIGLAGTCSSLLILIVSKQHILITPQFIRQHTHRGKTITLAWNEIALIKNVRFHKRIELADITGERTIKIEHQIELFYKLVLIIEERSGKKIEGL